jgi:RimJ/RimL family protein N-acetyltransferase
MPVGPITPIPTLSALPLVIEAPRVRLRPLEERDAEGLFPLVSDPGLPVMMTWSAHGTIDETRGWIAHTREARAAGTDMVWGIEHEGAVVGTIGLHDITWAVRAARVDQAELGFWIAPASQGKGLTTEAARNVTRWAFDTLGLHKVLVSCFEENVASRRVIEKCGFRKLCRQDEDIWRDGKWHAHLRYELIVADVSDVTNTLRFKRPV